jgi:hypothetical protein
VLDDGFAKLGAYGSENRTPNIDPESGVKSARLTA